MDEVITNFSEQIRANTRAVQELLKEMMEGMEI